MAVMCACVCGARVCVLCPCARRWMCPLVSVAVTATLQQEHSLIKGVSDLGPNQNAHSGLGGSGLGLCKVL